MAVTVVSILRHPQHRRGPGAVSAPFKHAASHSLLLQWGMHMFSAGGQAAGRPPTNACPRRPGGSFSPPYLCSRWALWGGVPAAQHC